jgi:ribonuclease HI
MPNITPNQKIIKAKAGRTPKYLKKHQDFIDHVQKIYDIVCFTDGSCLNLKDIGYSFVVTKGKEIVYSEKFDRTDVEMPYTVSVAEIMAVVRLLQYLEKIGEINSNIFIFSDSKFLVDYCMNVKWVSKSTQAPYYKHWMLLQSLVVFFPNLNCEWVPRELNVEADRLSKYEK